MCKITMTDFQAALDGLYGNVSAIARKLGVARSVVYRFLSTHPAAEKLLRAERDSFDDVAEETLRRKIMEGDSQLLKFYASTRLRSRGYSGDAPAPEQKPPEFRVTLQEDSPKS